jgi:hypothetical protein
MKDIKDLERFCMEEYLRSLPMCSPISDHILEKGSATLSLQGNVLKVIENRGANHFNPYLFDKKHLSEQLCLYKII